MIRAAEYWRMYAFVDRSGAAEIAQDVLHPPGRGGRPPVVTVKHWLTCMLLTVIHGRTLHMSEVRRLFTELHSTPLELQIAIGTRTVRSLDSRDDKVVSEAPFETRLRTYANRTAWLASARVEQTQAGLDGEDEAALRALHEAAGLTGQPVQVLDPAEIERRKMLQDEVARRLIQAMHPLDHAPTGMMAVDATGIETLGQLRQDGADPDARLGHRTAKFGERKTFHGYQFMVFTRIYPRTYHADVPGPRMFEHLVVRPANLVGGVGESSLQFALKAAADGHLHTLYADAAWFNVKAAEFHYPLQEAGVRVVVPPPVTMRSLVQWQGNPLYYRWPLCGGAPDHVVELARTLRRPAAITFTPGYTEDELEALATRDDDQAPEVDYGVVHLGKLEAEQEPRLEEDRDEYDDEPIPATGSDSDDEAAWWKQLHSRPYEERRSALKARKQKVYEATMDYLDAFELIRPWLLVRKELATADNGWVERFECPAKHGLVLCARCPLSQDVPETDLVAEPTTGTFCSITRPADKRDAAVRRGEIAPGTPLHVLSMQLPRNVRPKLAGLYPVGSPEWLRDVTLRQGVERDFSTVKTRSGTGLTKGYIAVGGQAAYSLLGAVVLAARTHLNVLAYLDRGGSTTDPLYAQLPELHGFGELTERQAQTIRRDHLAGDEPDAGAA